MKTFLVLLLFLVLNSAQTATGSGQNDKCTVPQDYTLDIDAIQLDRGNDVFMTCDNDNGDHYMVRTDIRRNKCVTIITFHDNELKEIQFHDWSSPHCIEFKEQGIDLVTEHEKFEGKNLINSLKGPK